MKKTAGIITPVFRALKNATGYLLEKQSPDGTWRDYNMPPGESYAWVTAVVGLALTKPPHFLNSQKVINHAASALLDLYTGYGWGYNSSVDCDADSTAWCMRFLSGIGYTFWPGVLQNFCRLHINADGQARTYANPEAFGSWAQPHQDVTPVVGMALHNIMPSFFDLICKAVLASYNEKLPWRSFWWNTDNYSIARNVELLSMAGLITENIKIGVVKWLSNLEQPDNAFDVAQRLSIVSELISCRRVFNHYDYVQDLLNRQKNDGSWPSSLALLTPPMFPDNQESAIIYSDQNGLMTTASAIYALKQWISKM
jgi:hypothetical protein